MSETGPIIRLGVQVVFKMKESAQRGATWFQAGGEIAGELSDCMRFIIVDVKNPTMKAKYRQLLVPVESVSYMAVVQ